MVGLNLKLSVTIGCMKSRKRMKNARNHGNKLQPENNHSRKDVLASAKATHTVLLEKVFRGL